MVEVVLHLGSNVGDRELFINQAIDIIENDFGQILSRSSLYESEAWGKEDQKDLYQEVLLQGWRSFQNFKGQSTFSTWLYKVALNTVLTFNKKNKRQEEIKQSVPTETVSAPSEHHEILYHVIRSLEEIDRMLITLHLDGYKNKEIAEITGMTTNHINVKLHRIKGNIVSAFKKVNHG